MGACMTHLACISPSGNKQTQTTGVCVWGGGGGGTIGHMGTIGPQYAYAGLPLGVTLQLWGLPSNDPDCPA